MFSKAFKNILLCVFFLNLLLNTFSLPAPARQKEKDLNGNIKILEETIKNKETYEIFLADDFEGSRPWQIYRGISFLNKTEFISKVPDLEAFLLEQKIYSKIYKNNVRNSLMIHSFLENPGKQNLDIRPQETIRLPPGVPIRFFLWVFSNDYNMSLKLIISQKKSKDLYYDIGSLKYEGWRRLETAIDIPPKNIKLHLSLQVPLEIKGLRIEPSPFQKRGVFYIYVDQMGFLLEKQKTIYPGSEVKDNWSFEY
ncbi:MAG: flagellar assembly protein FlaA [Leptospiraceae bacterium]|nr:flagellar assembly protein FlaA [Leptospiraceae bacterium]MCK6382467.1 flagellar assembly protein FlaA [Leptospiraceae bacterium]NUM40932.1 flagellar assembly protein FlaA [Leptospiraceae bacterium]